MLQQKSERVKPLITQMGTRKDKHTEGEHEPQAFLISAHVLEQQKRML